MKVHRKVRLYEKKLILLIFSLFVLLICSESYFYIMSKKYPEIKISQEQTKKSIILIFFHIIYASSK